MTRPSNSQPSNSHRSSQELLERGRHILQAIQYHERAARYKAAAASLQAAMVQAENGNIETLHEWLELESHQFRGGMDLLHFQDHDFSTSEPETPARSIRIDQPVVEADAARVESEDGSIRNAVDRIESPWVRMEKAAEGRLSATRTVIPKSPAAIDSLKTANDLFKVLAVGSDLTMDRESDGHISKHWWKAPHVWVSLFVHVALIVCLSIVAITAAQEPKLLSIVSASVEAENVLLETPMEMISELETISEPMLSASLPTLSDLVNEVSLPNVSIETGSYPSPPPNVSTVVKGSASESAQSSMMGSKMLTGAEFFGAKATGNTFVYIVDSSPSMRRDGAFEAARKEIVRSLSSMKPKQRYFISFFGKEIDPMVFEYGVIERFPVYAKPENLTKTIDWLSRVQVQKEGLPPNNALAEAIGMQPDGIFLLFDGDTKVDVAKYLRRVNRSDDILSAGMPKVPIHVVHFFQDAFQKQMRQVAVENGGTYRFIPRPERPAKGNR